MRVKITYVNLFRESFAAGTFSGCGRFKTCRFIDGAVLKCVYFFKKKHAIVTSCMSGG